MNSASGTMTNDQIDSNYNKMHVFSYDSECVFCEAKVPVQSIFDYSWDPWLCPVRIKLAARIGCKSNFL